MVSIMVLHAIRETLTMTYYVFILSPLEAMETYISNRCTTSTQSLRGDSRYLERSRRQSAENTFAVRREAECDSLLGGINCGDGNTEVQTPTTAQPHQDDSFPVHSVNSGSSYPGDLNSPESSVVSADDATPKSEPGDLKQPEVHGRSPETGRTLIMPTLNDSVSDKNQAIASLPTAGPSKPNEDTRHKSRHKHKHMVLLKIHKPIDQNTGTFKLPATEVGTDVSDFKPSQLKEATTGRNHPADKYLQTTPRRMNTAEASTGRNRSVDRADQFGFSRARGYRSSETASGRNRPGDRQVQTSPTAITFRHDEPTSPEVSPSYTYRRRIDDSMDALSKWLEEAYVTVDEWLQLMFENYCWLILLLFFLILLLHHFGLYWIKRSGSCTEALLKPQEIQAYQNYEIQSHWWGCWNFQVFFTKFRDFITGEEVESSLLPSLYYTSDTTVIA